MVKVGINGFGRIGRLVIRAIASKRKTLKNIASFPRVVAINDPFLTVKHMHNILKYDSTHGRYRGELAVIGSGLEIDGELTEISHERDIQNIPWAKGCVEYVIDCTGLHKTSEKAAVHFNQGVSRVLISAPTKKCVPMFVFGVNHGDYSNDMKIISNASCTTNCLAPLLKVLDDNFGIEQGLMTTIHAITPSQNTLDGPSKKNFRIGRGALQNIIPSSTGAAKAIAKIIPKLEGKINGMAVRVPVPDASLVDLTVLINNPCDFPIIKSKIKEAADTYMQGILGYTDEEVVSSDIIGDSRSCIFDASASMMLSPNFLKLITWYDNEYGYACRIVDMLNYMASRECK